jgi:hypothetical protein
MEHLDFRWSACRRPVTGLLLLFMWLMAHTGFSQSTANDLTVAWLGTINQNTLSVSGLPSNGRVAQLLSASAVSAGATLKVVNSAGQPVPKNTVLSSSLSVLVTAANGAQKSYALQPTGAAITVETISNASSSTQANITDRILEVSGNSEFHITGTANLLKGTMIDMQGDNVWLYFEGMKPSKFNQRLLAQVTINGQRARVDTTVRLVQYLQGCVLISQPSTYQPLEAFVSAAYGGNSMQFNQYSYYKAPELGAFHDNIGSFKLKKGYMATFAENPDGTGFSKVYIAPDNDVTISTLPLSLQGRISMVRVLPWAWVSKKGWCSAPLLGDSLHSAWNYNWNNNGQSTLDMEYVPIRQTQYWPDFATTNNKKKVTHFLGFNEPNTSSQSNMTVNQAIAAWPGLLQSGLRVGSPAPTDGGANWLYQFMDKADSAGYRVDFVAVHFYRGCQTPRQFYDFLKATYDRTKRPIWITEWNNGANWTTSSGCPKPTYADQAAKIQAFITMLDTARIVERYSLYQWVEDTRKMFVNDGDPTSITPAGIVYRDKISPMAFNPNLVPPTVSVPVPIPFGRGNLAVTRFGNPGWTGGTFATIPVYIDEVVPMNSTLYTAGQFIRSVTIPTGNYGSNFGYVGSAMKANADGALALSPDRTKMALAGFNLSTGNTNPNGSNAARVVAILDADGNLDTRTGFSDGNGQPLRTSTVTDSATVYIAYGASGLGLKHASLPTVVSSTPRTRTGTTIFPVISLKKIAVYEGQMYFTQNTTGSAKVMKLPGLPGRATTPTPLPGLPLQVANGPQPSGFVMFDVNPTVPGFDLLYYTDDPASGGTASVLNKYTFNGTTWTARGTYTVTGLNDNILRDLTGTLVRGVPTFFAVSLTSIVKLVDNSTTYTLANTAFTNALSVALTPLVNSQAATATNYGYRGISFTPGTRDSLYVRVPQTITFSTIADKALGAADFYPTATTTSGLQLGYATSDLNVATVNNGLVSIVGPGTVTITVSQTGDFKYLSATSVSRTFTVLNDLTVASGQQMSMATAGNYGNVMVQGTLTLSAPLAAAGTITVASGGVLSTNCQPITGAANFMVEPGAELRVCDAAGLLPTGMMSGAVQTTGTRTFSTDATYTYMGTVAQLTGTGLPAEVRNLRVQNLAGVSLSAPLAVTQVLRLGQGNLTLGGNALTLRSDVTGTALVDNAGGVVNGTVTVQRYLDPSLNPGLGYRHYAAPVSNTTVADLTTSNFTPNVNPAYNTGSAGSFPTVFGYDQSRLTTAAAGFDQGWYSPATMNTPLTVGQGYTVNLPATALVDFVGTLNNGAINLSLTRGVPAEAGWQLLGNPYPAPLDWRTVTVPTGLDNAMYVYQSTSQYGGNYRSFVNGVGSSSLVPSGQGFFVRVSNAGSTPSLALTNANRVTTFGPQPTFNRTAETRPLVQLRLTGAGASDDAYVYFEASTTAAVDARYDAGKLRNVGPAAVNVFSLAATQELSINGLPAPGTQSLVVPLGLTVAQPGTYTLRAEQLVNQTGTVSLRDALTGTVVRLDQQPSYTFTVAAGALATGRFSLLFGPQQVLSTTNALSQQVALFPNPAHGEVQLSLPTTLQSETLKAEVLNALGQTVLTRTLPAGALRTLPLTGLPTGVYTVRIASNQGSISKRLILQ